MAAVIVIDRTIIAHHHRFIFFLQMGNRPSSKVSIQKTPKKAAAPPPPAAATGAAPPPATQQGNQAPSSPARSSSSQVIKPVLPTYTINNLKLHFNISSDCQDQIRQINAIQGVKNVDLSGNTFSVEAAKCFASALKVHPQIENVNLSDCFTSRLKEEVPLALEAFGGMLMTRGHLKVLNLSDNAYGPVGAKAIATFLPNLLMLEELRLNNNGLGPEGGQIIARALVDLRNNQRARQMAPTLKLVSCGRNRLENGSCLQWGEALEAHAESLESVAFYQNGIRPEGISQLSGALSKCPRLRHVDLQDNTFTEAGSRAFAQAVPSWPSLEHLNIGDCLLGAGGSIAVLEALVANSQLVATVKHLSLSYAEMNERGAQLLCDHLAQMTSLQQLLLNGNGFNPTDRAALGILTVLKSVGKEGIVDEWDEMDYEEETEEESEPEVENKEESDQEVGEEAPEEETRETRELEQQLGALDIQTSSNEEALTAIPIDEAETTETEAIVNQVVTDEQDPVIQEPIPVEEAVEPEVEAVQASTVQEPDVPVPDTINNDELAGDQAQELLTAENDKALPDGRADEAPPLDFEH